MGPTFAYGYRRLMDQGQRFIRYGSPTYLRLRNFPDLQNQPYAQMGFSASGSPAGTTDILIVPPPSWYMVSVHNIGQSDGKLRFGARIFKVSQTFVQAQVDTGTFTDSYHMWNSPLVVGLITDGLLFSIENITHDNISSVPVWWELTANANELR